MSESPNSAAKKSGLPAGSLVHVGEVHNYAQRRTLIHYTEHKITRCEINNIDDILLYQHIDGITWINIEGLHDIELIDAIGKNFEIDNLTLEDILNTHQRPKLEDHDHYLYIVLKGLTLDKEQPFEVCHEQVSILLLKDYVFTFKEKPDAMFDTIITSFNNDKAKVRRFGTDYLTYVLMDTIVDEYFTLQDTLDDLLENVETELLSAPSNKTLVTIQRVKRELAFIRKSVAPTRELLVNLQRNDTSLINDKTRRYFNDVYDHAIRVIEAIETYRDLITGMLDIYLSSVSNKMNETMKILTIFSTIFIPLTFIVGVYGMNFDYMPELHWRWAYPLLWVAFIVLSLFLLAYFKKKHWL